MQTQLYFEGIKEGVRWREAPLPRLVEDTDALVKPIVVARCDFDTQCLFEKLHLMLRMGLRAGAVDTRVCDHFGAEPFAPPFAVGHEFIAEVAECGEAVTAFSPGDRVVVPFQVSCGECEPCQSARSGECAGLPPSSLFGFGDRGGRFGGALCDLMRIPFASHMLFRLPKELSPIALASAGDNLTIAYQGVAHSLKERPDSRVLVLGGGCASIALYAIGIAAALGVPSVDYVDIDHDGNGARRMEVAERLGARAAFTLDKFVASGEYDLCVDASSSAAALERGLSSLARGGVCNCIGMHFGAAVRLPLFPMYMNGVTLRVGWGNPREDMESLLTWIGRSTFDPGLLNTCRADWSEAHRAWLEPGTKVVLVRSGVEG